MVARVNAKSYVKGLMGTEGLLRVMDALKRGANGHAGLY